MTAIQGSNGNVTQDVRLNGSNDNVTFRISAIKSGDDNVISRISVIKRK